MTDTLLLTAAKALKLDDDIAAFEALAKLEIGPWPVEGFSDAEALLDSIAAGLQSDAVDRVFSALGLEDEQAQIVGFVAKVKATGDKIPDKYKALLERLGDVRQAGGGKVDWKISQSAQTPAALTDRYALDIEASAGLIFEPAATLGDATKLLKISASGEVKAGAGVALPYDLTGRAKAKVATATSLAYYFTAQDADLYGVAVAKALKSLPAPFDFKSIWAAFQANASLQAIVYDFDGTAGAEVAVSFADFTVPGLSALQDIKLAFGVSAEVKSDYKLTLRRLPGAALALEADLTRDRVLDKKLDASLSAGLDVSSVTEPVAKAVKDVVGEWDTVQKKIKPYLTPGTYLRDKLNTALDTELQGLIQDADLRKAVLADARGALGLDESKDSAIAGWLSTRVVSAIDKGKVLVDGKVNEAVDRVMAELAKSLPITLSEGPAGKVKALVTKQVDKIATQFVTDVKADFTAGGAEFRQALNKAGVQVSAAVTSADDAVAPVRELLAKYDAKLHAVLDAAELAVKAQVTARLSLEERRIDGTTVEVSGVFSKDTDETRLVFRSLALGHLQAVVRLIDEARDVDGFDLNADESHIKRYGRYTSKEGLEIVFLGFELKAAQLIAVDASVDTDGNGVVRVDTKAEMSKSLWTPWGKREVSFADVYRITRAERLSQDPNLPIVLEMGVGALFSDDKLDIDDITDLGKPMAKFGLLDPAALVAADLVFRDWLADAGDDYIDGDISANLRLDRAELKTLLCLGPNETHVIDDTDRERIILAGLTALLECGAVNAKQLGKGLGGAASLFIGPDPDVKDPAKIFLTYQDKLPPWTWAGENVVPTVNNTPAVTNDTQSHWMFLRTAFALTRLVELIEAMRAIYDSHGAWSKGVYSEKQVELTRLTTTWLKVFKDLASIGRSGVSPWTLAFMQALCVLAVPAGTPAKRVTLKLTYRHPTDPRSVSFE